VDSGQVRLRGARSFVFGLVCVLLLAPLSFAAGLGFAPQQRLGFTSGDQWEPAIAADGYGHVYVLYPQYVTVPGCAACSTPSMVLQVSKDNGVSWKPPRPIAGPRSAQFDAQIVIDPADRETVYAAWLENDKTDIALARSIDFGESWTVEIAVRNPAGMDRPVLAIRGRDLYVGYGQSRELGVAASHDGGLTFASSTVNPNPLLGWSLAGGGSVDPDGNVYFAWAGYLRSGPKGPVVLYVAKSQDGAKTWNNTLLDVSAPAPDCAEEKCGWAYLGAQITMTSDSAGTLYALWNAGREAHGEERIYFASSTTSGVTWSPKQVVSTAAAEHAFPAIAAGEPGDIRIAWMDARNPPFWNTYSRSSTNGGATWSTEARLSSYVHGYSYVEREGFRFPFGDYFGLAVDNLGETHAVWGEGRNYESPGSIWYSHGR
jgi:hypothetical protein